MNNTDLLKRLQGFMRSSKVYEILFKADAEQLNQRNTRIADLVLQLSVDTATWGLAFYEHEYGISIDERKPLTERRSQIKAKMRGTGAVTSQMIKDVAMAFTGGQIAVGFNEKIIITFTDVIGTPPNIEDFKAAIEEIKPAFLDVAYYFLYNQYRDLISFTYGQLVEYTYEQLRSARLN